jgi:hypothetical protein
MQRDLSEVSRQEEDVSLRQIRFARLRKDSVGRNRTPVYVDCFNPRRKNNGSKPLGKHSSDFPARPLKASICFTALTRFPRDTWRKEILLQPNQSYRHRKTTRHMKWNSKGWTSIPDPRQQYGACHLAKRAGRERAKWLVIEAFVESSASHGSGEPGANAIHCRLSGIDVMEVSAMEAMHRNSCATAREFGRALHLTLLQPLDLESDRNVLLYRPGITRRTGPNNS